MTLDRVRTLLMLALLALALPVCAKEPVWHEVSSEHFVIYSKQSPHDLRYQSEILERFHHVLQQVSGVNEQVTSESNRLTIYVVDDRKAALKHFDLDERNAPYILFQMSAGNSLAVVPSPFRSTRLRQSPSMSTLVHKYAGLYLRSTSERNYPSWFERGFVLYCAQLRLETRKAFRIGWPDALMVQRLRSDDKVPLDTLLNGASTLEIDVFGRDAQARKSWLLFHYLQFATTGREQLSAYLRLLESGSSLKESAVSAFGDLDQLEIELKRHARRPLSNRLYDTHKFDVGDITLRKLDSAESSMLPIDMRLRFSPSSARARILAADAGNLALRFPDNPYVLEVLSRGLTEAGLHQQAIAIADRALEQDDTRITAHVQKAKSLLALGGASEDASNDWPSARKQAIVANQLEPNHPIPLVIYADTFLRAKETPSKNAVASAEGALALAPFDPDVRLTVARVIASAGNIDRAVEILKPMIDGPYPPEQSQAAHDLLESLLAPHDATVPVR